MSDTKENILMEALHLFAIDGYEAVSVSMIANALGMTKGALYKHYKNKRDIFDSIVKRMEELDSKQAEQYEMPQGTLEQMPEVYKSTTLKSIKEFTKAQFIYWTENEFASDFRKMLTLEQYRSDEIKKLYQQYLAEGPLKYMIDIFANMDMEDKEAERCALSFYGPIFMMYSLYDATEDKSIIKNMLNNHLQNFIDINFKNQLK